ncbi:hypothetical protein TSUD_200000 [Trifolium subterraneum]|nr:hypothetical protein TSUD_200000 [Trifolium subterraneum]
METLEQIDAHQTQSSSSSSSSIDSNNYSSCCRNRTDLSTDLKLGLSISPSSQSQLPFNSTTPREETFAWPPVNKSVLRRNNFVDKKQDDIHDQRSSLFVKVYMEGIPIGRKLNLLEHDSYDGLIKALCHMFKTIIISPNSQPLNSWNFHVLTYEDEEGDWMMVGDVPWEPKWLRNQTQYLEVYNIQTHCVPTTCARPKWMFLSSVKRLKITRANSC